MLHRQPKSKSEMPPHIPRQCGESNNPMLNAAKNNAQVIKCSKKSKIFKESKQINKKQIEAGRQDNTNVIFARQ